MCISDNEVEKRREAEEKQKSRREAEEKDNDCYPQEHSSCVICSAKDAQRTLPAIYQLGGRTEKAIDTRWKDGISACARKNFWAALDISLCKVDVPVAPNTCVIISKQSISAPTTRHSKSFLCNSEAEEELKNGKP